MGEGEDERPPEFDSILEMTGLDPDQVCKIWMCENWFENIIFCQVDSLKKGFDGFDKEGGTINQTTMMMILKSMGVDVNKVGPMSSSKIMSVILMIYWWLQTDMENYSSEVDEQETGKFNFSMFCQVKFHHKVDFSIFSKTFRQVRTILHLHWQLLGKNQILSG